MTGAELDSGMLAMRRPCWLPGRIRRTSQRNQIETLLTCCRKEISWGRNVGGPGYKLEREEIVEKYFRSSKFEEFFEEFKKGKHAEGDLPWADSVSPRST